MSSLHIIAVFWLSAASFPKYLVFTFLMSFLNFACCAAKSPFAWFVALSTMAPVACDATF
jgi:hypothetical protein